MVDADALDRVAVETAFSGVVRIDVDGEPPFLRAYGMADRAHGVPNSTSTQFGVASGSKGLTALAVMRLVELGAIELSTTARSLLGPDLPLIDDAVTVEQLLSHRSGIGDYLDEDAPGEVTDYVMTVPVHELATTEAFLAMLEGHANKFAPGQDFSYCNGGYVVLALLAERATGRPFHDLVHEHVIEPAGLSDTEFLRMDELPGTVAVGYLEATGLRTNVLHLPVRANGDGGIFTTAADVHALWAAFFAGRIVSSSWVVEMVRPRSQLPSGSHRYGLGFWLGGTSDAVQLEGCDPGASFRSTHRPSEGITCTVLSNTSAGAWPILDHLANELIL